MRSRVLVRRGVRRTHRNREAGANPALPRNCKRGHRLGPLKKFGKDRAEDGFCKSDTDVRRILTRKPGDRRDRTTQPLSRLKEEVMRFCSRLSAVVFLSLLLPSGVLASELTVKVIDPSSAAVPNAQVEVFAGSSSAPIAVESTSAQGSAHFDNLPDG